VTAIAQPTGPRVGDAAPDFTLSSTAGGAFALSSLRGKQNVLLAFFPLAFTSTCTAQMCAFSDDLERFAGAGTTVLPISVDSVDTLKEFRAKHGIKLEMLSDFRRDVSRAYGVLNEAKFYSNRAYFLIDRQGRVRWAFQETDNRERRDDAELLRQIAALGA
jgi:mycoredoxin-dependent peroxiredoxin